jgi:hypothetical protein
VVGVATGPRVAHLEELAGHVHADEVVLLFVGEEHGVDLPRGFARYLFGLEAPVRQDLGLVRLDEEDALFPLPHPVQVRLLAQVEVFVVEGVVEA